MNALWTVQALIFFAVTLIIATPFFVWGIIENKKYYKLHGTYNRNKIIFPIKVIGGGVNPIRNS